MAGQDEQKSLRRQGAASASVFLIVAVCFMVLIRYSDSDPRLNITRAKFDQDTFHLPVIRQFAQQWPTPDFSNYLSATTPGYHLAMSTLIGVSGKSDLVLTLRTSGAVLIAFFFVIGVFAAALKWRESQRSSPTRTSGYIDVAVALAIALPLLASSYIVQSAMYLLPDNLAWLFVSLVITSAVAISRAGWRVRPSWLVCTSVLMMLLVFTRQIHIWAAAPIWIAVLVNQAMMRRGTSTDASTSPAQINPTSIPELLRAVTSRAVAFGVVATVPAFIILGYFIWLWGGIAPPMFRAATNPLAASGTGNATAVTGLSPASPVLILALIGIFGTFYLGWIVSASMTASRGWLPRIDNLWGTLKASAIGAAAAALIAIVPPTTWSTPTRKGALWEITRRFEGGSEFAGVRLPRLVIADHTNLIMWFLAVLGGAILGLLWRGVDHRARWVLATALIAFTAAQSAQALSWQRYFEPFVLLWLILCVSNLRIGGRSGDIRMPAEAPPQMERWAWLGPVVLTVMLASITYAAFGS